MDWFLWVKVIHILAVISWLAGLLYLPRLFVYHAESLAKGEEAGVFIIMESRLLRAIMNPAMIVVWLSGLSLGWLGGFLFAPWFLAKLSVVVLLSVCHMFFASERRKFASGANFRNPRFFRIANEVPTVLMIFIVTLVVIKPWL